MDNIPLAVSQDLKFNMAGMLHKMLDIHRIIPESHTGFLLSCLKCKIKFICGKGRPHAFSSAAQRGLDHDRITDPLSLLFPMADVVDRIFCPRYNGHSCFNHRVPCL